MDTNRLKQFCAIAETGSLTQAAQLLHVTHSALSKSMKLLQQELNCVLLQPAGRGLVVTSIGWQMYERAKTFLKQEENFFKLEPLAKQNTLKIGTVEIFLIAMGELLTDKLFGEHATTFLDLNPGDMEQMIIDRQLDYGLTYAPFSMKDLEIVDIGKYRLGCYHLKNAFQGQAIAEIPFVVPNQGLSANPLGIRERDGWLDSVFPREKKYVVNLLSTGIELTLQGLCAIYIPDFVARKINQTRKVNEQLVQRQLPKNQEKSHRAFMMRHKENVDIVTFKRLCLIMKKLFV
jgi:DNA-binding transcriptional LysR family regulator